MARRKEHAELDETPVERISHFLDEQGVAHEIVEHDKAPTAMAEAHATGTPPEDVVKGVLLHTGAGYQLAVIPASERLDLDKVRAVSGEVELRLATEEEMAVLMPDVEPGALPPLAPNLPMPEIVDAVLLEHDRVLCSAGSHRHGVWVDPNEIVRLGDATVTEIRAD